MAVEVRRCRRSGSGRGGVEETWSPEGSEGACRLDGVSMREKTANGERIRD